MALDEFNTVAPLPDVIDDYYAKDGMPISTSPEYDPAQPYANRDPRLQATYTVIGSNYKGAPVKEGQYPRTGYGQKKYTIYKDDVKPAVIQPSGQSELNYIVLRYADVLLMFAEAQNEATGPTDEIRQALHLIRERAGMPDIPDGLTKDQLRKEIRHERRIELAGEGLYYFDIRRWKTAEAALNTEIYNYKGQRLDTRRFNAAGITTGPCPPLLSRKTPPSNKIHNTVNKTIKIMTRKTLLTIVCAALLPALAQTASAQQARKPNIIFIVADDLGYGNLTSYNPSHKVPTPNIDRLAKEGIRFTRFYSGSTVCAPSRCALMTGKHMGHAYIRGNSRSPLRLEDTTLATRLHNNGYATGMFGKWGLGEENTTGAPERHGFTAFYGYLNQTHAHHYYTNRLFELQQGVTKEVRLDSTEYSDELIVRKALQFIDDNKNKPFFLYLPLPFRMPNCTCRTNTSALAQYRRQQQTGAGNAFLPGGGEKLSSARQTTCSLRRYDHQAGRRCKAYPR